MPVHGLLFMDSIYIRGYGRQGTGEWVGGGLWGVTGVWKDENISHRGVQAYCC